MISRSEALRRIAASVRPLGGESVALSQAVGRVLRATLRARTALPPFDNSTMDGYAVRVRDLAAASPQRPTRLSIGGVVAAGALARRGLKSGEAFKIMTGAPIPRGADAVVMNEETRPDGDGVAVLRAPEAGEFIRPRGEDVRRGELLVDRGARLRPYEVALLAAQGVDEVPVFRRPNVAVLATGDELVAPGSDLAPGRIRDSNSPSIRSHLSRWGLKSCDLGIVGDEPALLESAFRQALLSADVVIASGGVSRGDFDFTEPLMRKLGVKTVFWHVAIRPGKPLFFGLAGAKPVFGLPGNPLAVLVCMEEFVKPVLDGLEGAPAEPPAYPLRGVCENAFRLPRGRRQFLFARARSVGVTWKLRLLSPQGSHMLGRAVRADALALSPEGAETIEAGMELTFRMLA